MPPVTSLPDKLELGGDQEDYFSAGVASQTFEEDMVRLADESCDMWHISLRVREAGFRAHVHDG